MQLFIDDIETFLSEISQLIRAKNQYKKIDKDRLYSREELINYTDSVIGKDNEFAATDDITNDDNISWSIQNRLKSIQRQRNK